MEFYKSMLEVANGCLLPAVQEGIVYGVFFPTLISLLLRQFFKV